jgi:sulfur carrier protein ThiS
VKVTIVFRKVEYSWESSGSLTAKEALQGLGLHPEAFLILYNGELISPDTSLQDGDMLKLIPALSGGER